MNTATKTEFLMSNGLCNFFLLKVMGSPNVWSVKSISVVKEYNLKRHYKSRHEAKCDNIRRQKIVYCTAQKNFFVPGF